MTSNEGHHSSLTPTDALSSLPTLQRSSTAPTNLDSPRLASLHYHRHDRSHLAPEDAYALSPPQRHPLDPAASVVSPERSLFNGGPDNKDNSRNRSRSRNRRRKKRQQQPLRYKKLLWVKQSYPDNYTDQATFLESLQRNPRLQPYQFWTLFADSTVIVQQVCAVVIFAVCFSLIFQERLSCTTVAAGSSLATFLGWVLWLLWEWKAQDAAVAVDTESWKQRHCCAPFLNNSPSKTRDASTASGSESVSGTTTSLLIPRTRCRHRHMAGNYNSSTALSTSEPRGHIKHASHDLGTVSYATTGAGSITTAPGFRPRQATTIAAKTSMWWLQPNMRWQNLAGTIKSSFLIIVFVGGVSPILKSLTRSFASDSIWAMSSFLLLINLFFFDYSIGIHSAPSSSGNGSGNNPTAVVASSATPGASVQVVAGMPRSGPAAFALNSATMASTVLASRLPQTSQVFGLTVFSMEMFALFPIFRRYARHHSLVAHVAITSLLILGAGTGAGIAFGAHPTGQGAGKILLRNASRGCLVAVTISVLAMGGCSYWLISLQKYKNAIIGPWDPAKPVIVGGLAASSRMHHFQSD